MYNFDCNKRLETSKMNFFATGNSLGTQFVAGEHGVRRASRAAICRAIRMSNWVQTAVRSGDDGQPAVDSVQSQQRRQLLTELEAMLAGVAAQASEGHLQVAPLVIFRSVQRI